MKFIKFLRLVIELSVAQRKLEKSIKADDVCAVIKYLDRIDRIESELVAL